MIEPHLYAVDWDADEAVFTVDGVVLRRCPRPPTYPLQLMLTVYDFPEWSVGDDAHLVPRLVVDRIAGLARDRPSVRDHAGGRPARRGGVRVERVGRRGRLADRARPAAGSGARRESLAGRRVAHVWTSTLARAVQTGEIVAARLGVGVTTRRGLCEFCPAT